MCFPHVLYQTFSLQSPCIADSHPLWVAITPIVQVLVVNIQAYIGFIKEQKATWKQQIIINLFYKPITKLHSLIVFILRHVLVQLYFNVFYWCGKHRVYWFYLFSRTDIENFSLTLNRNYKHHCYHLFTWYGSGLPTFWFSTYQFCLYFL